MTGTLLSTALLCGLFAGDLTVEVSAGAYDRRDVPVSVVLPADRREAIGATATELDSGATVPVQITAGERPEAVWIVGLLPKETSRRYRIRFTDEPGAENVSCKDDGRALDVAIRGEPVLRYNTAVVEPPEKIDPLYERSGFVHPLRSLAGRVVTDDFPPDHAHQNGLFFAWVNTTFAGMHPDFWNRQNRTGTVRHVRVLERTSGPVFGQFRASLQHQAIAPGGRKIPALDEFWTVRVYDATDKSYLVDFTSEQTCAGSEPLTVNQYHYGGLGFRGNRQWFDKEAKGEDPPAPGRSGHGDFLTSEGRTRKDGNHTRPTWVDLSGSVSGGYAGVTILDHPENFRAPQPVRLHPNKPYLSIAPEVVGAFTIEPGKPYRSRSRLVVHDGPPDRERNDRHQHDLADPPRVRIVED